MSRLRPWLRDLLPQYAELLGPSTPEATTSASASMRSSWRSPTAQGSSYWSRCPVVPPSTGRPADRRRRTPPRHLQGSRHPSRHRGRGAYGVHLDGLFQQTGGELLNQRNPRRQPNNPAAVILRPKILGHIASQRTASGSHQTH